MKKIYLNYFLISLLLTAKINESQALIGGFLRPIKEVMKGLIYVKKNFLKKERIEEDHIYAIPHPSGHGFVLQNYGPPAQLKEYDNDVDIEQHKKGFTGKIIVPNFLGSPEQVLNKKWPRIIRGSDNRYGIRIAIPFLGDIQYIRELGPGRFIDDLGPGHFDYPGVKALSKRLLKSHANAPGHYGNQHAPNHPDSHSNSYSSYTSYRTGNKINTFNHNYNHQNYPTSSRNKYHPSSYGDSNYPSYHRPNSHGSVLNNNKYEALKSLRNYPWY